MKIIKKIIVSILVCACIFSSMPLMNVMASKVKYSGVSGKIHWKVDSNGTLTLKGKGEAYRDYNYNGEFIYEWIRYNDEIRKVVVNVSGITDATSFFKNLKNVTVMDLQKFDTSKVTDMTDMFYGCQSLTKLNVSTYNTKNVVSMKEMFQNCKSLKSLDLRSFDTTKVSNMANMFDGCENLTQVNLSGFDTKNVTSMMRMFGDCKSLKQLDLSGFNTKNLAGIEGMFANCNKLSTTLTLVKIPSTDKGIFVDAATTNGAKITLNYGGEYTLDMVRDLIGVQTQPSNIVLGKKQNLKLQTINVKTVSKSLKQSALKKKSQKINLGAKAKTKLTYEIITGGKYISVSSDGTVSIKKGAPKGTYHILVKAKATSKYHSAVKHVMIIVK